MIKRIRGMRGIALAALLAGGATLHAQVPTPTITSLQSGPSGDYDTIPSPVYGAAITACTPYTLTGTYYESGAGFFLYINGAFDPEDFENNATWTVSGTPTQLVTVSVQDNQMVSFVPRSLFANAGSATITVTQTEGEPPAPAPVAGMRDRELPPVTSNGLTFTVNAAMASIGNLPTGDAGFGYSQPFFTGGTSPFTVASLTAPAGLNYTATTGNPLFGMPTTAGLAQSVSASITDEWGNTFTPQDLVNINPAPQITTASLSSAVVNAMYPTTTLTAMGGTMPYVWAATGLPAGLSLSAGGILSGTPTASGHFTAIVTLTDNISDTAQASFPFNIYAVLTITPTTLPSVVVNTAYPSTTLTESGGTPAYNWHATGLPAGMTLSTAGVLSGTPTVSGSFTASVTLTDGSSQTAFAQFPFVVYAILTIAPTTLPSGQVGQGYNGGLSGSGGLPPYTWAATGLPPGLSMNAASGSISGNPTQSGSYTANVTLTDRSGQTARAALGININPAPPPPVTITTASLPNATVGVQYYWPITASGGNGAYTFIATGGLPPGMQVASNGQLQGIPTAPGNFSFSVTATDSTGSSGSGTVSITVVAASLVITTGALSSVQAGALFSVTFTATGGVSPYTFSLGGSGPAGANLTSSGAFTWTPTTPGSYSFTVSVTDSAKTTASKGFTLVVTPAALAISASLPTGTAGLAYSGQFTATGGTPPYSWSGSAGGGLSVSSTGAVSGTPTAAGTYSVSVTVTDSLGIKATGSFPVTVNSSSLTVTTSTLPNGTLTSAYSASVSATGGTPPYSWSASGLPAGISLSTTGTLSGTPTAQGAFTVSVTVKDATGVSASANLSLTISASPLKITTTSIPSATLGTAYSASFAATGGAPPYTWTASGLPAGVSIGSTGTLSGTPTAAGASSITVNVADSNELQATETLSLTVALPPAPAVTFTGLPDTVNPATQSNAAVTFSITYPVAVTVNLTLTFAPLSGADDPNIQFSTGGRTATLTVPAGATASSASIGVQTGTVAGTITITSQLLAAGQDITPTPAPTKTIVIAPAAPSITSLTATTNSTGFSVTLDGFDTTRAITEVVFTFTAAAGSNLQTTSVTIPAATLFSGWYQSSASAPYGSQFSFTIPFTVTGNVQSIASVTVTLVNPTGTSSSMTASL